MNWTLGLVMLGAIPLLATAFWALTQVLPPLAGYGLGLCLYWLLIGLLTLRSTTREERATLSRFVRPGRLLSLLSFLPVVALAGVALGTLQTVTLPAIMFLVIALAALTNGTLEEMFWRVAILPRPDREGIVTAWALFVGWHVALIFAQGVHVTGGPLALLAGAGLLGILFMALRLRTGTAGAGIACHVGINLFAFTDLVGRNWPATG